MLILLILPMFAAAARDICLKDFGTGDFNQDNQALGDEIVKLDFYYESKCPYSIQTYVDELVPAVKDLGASLKVATIPYGNAHTIQNNSQVTIECQHGPEECYGNMLHACAMDSMQNIPNDYVPFNACMMEYDRNVATNDEAADACGKKLNVDPKPIKACAKSLKGFKLLLMYGEISSKVTYPGVPWIYINNVSTPRDDTVKNMVCKAFKKKPKTCESG